MLGWLKDGVRCPWLRGPPPPFHRGCSRFPVEKEREFLRGEVARCLGTGAWERVPQEAARFVSRAFLVPKPNGKFRLVIDLRFLNQHCQAWKCRFEGLSTLR